MTDPYTFSATAAAAGGGFADELAAVTPRLHTPEPDPLAELPGLVAALRGRAAQARGVAELSDWLADRIDLYAAALARGDAPPAELLARLRHDYDRASATLLRPE